jgi:hypothetical protein
LEKLVYICIPQQCSKQAGKSKDKKSKKNHFGFGKKKKAFIFAIRFEKKESQNIRGSLKF